MYCAYFAQAWIATETGLMALLGHRSDNGLINCHADAVVTAIHGHTHGVSSAVVEQF